MEIWLDVDAALSEVPVNKIALIDDTDFKTREESVTFDQAGLDLVWNFTTTAGVTTQTAVTPTDTAGVYDWVNQGNGMYTIEIPASGGASINNDIEGFGWFTGFATGILPWTGPIIGFRHAELNNIMVDAADISQMPATQSQVNSIGSGATGGTHVEATYDNTTQDTIDNAAAVDKGGGLVGIPVTGHAFVAGREVTIAGTVNYNGAFEVISQTANEVVITDTFVSETFGGSETIVSSIKGEVFVGTVTSGTFADTAAENGVLFSIDADTDDVNLVLGYNIGGSRQATDVAIFANVNGNTDEITVKVFNFVTQLFELKGTISGSGGTSFVPLDPELVARNTGTGTEIGDVFVLFDTVSTTPSSLDIDKCLITAVGTNTLIGYPNGFEIAAAGTSGTEFGVNGTSGNPCPFADALAMNAVTPLNKFEIHNGETITLAANSDGISLSGDIWTLLLNSASIVSMHARGAKVSGLSTGAGADFHDCDVGTVTVAPCSVTASRFTSKTAGGFTMLSAGNFTFHNCASMVAGNDAPVFTFPAAGNTFVSDRAGSGGRQYEGMTAGDLASIEGWGQFIEGTNSGGAVTIRGCLTTSGVSTITLTDDARFDVQQINAEVDNALNTAIPGAPTADSINERIAAIDDIVPYMPAAIYIDTVGGAAGTTKGTHGTRANPSDSVADSVTLAASVGVNEYRLLGASSITLTTPHLNWAMYGQNGASVNVGAQNTSGTHYECLTLTGDMDGNETTQRFCKFQSLTNFTANAEFCMLIDNVTESAGEHYWFQCASAVAGTGTPYIDANGDGVNARNNHLRGWFGGVEMRTHTSADTMSFDCPAGQIVVAASCTGGTIAMRGNIDITDSASGAVTFDENPAVNMSKINTEADTALTDYGGLKPTVASRTLDVTATGEAGVDLDNTSGTLAAAQFNNDTIDLFAQGLNGVTWYVDKTGNDGNTGQSFGSGRAFLTVGAAVAAATSGDSIRIGPGTFSETVNATAKSLNFVGQGKGLTILTGSSGSTLDLADNSLVQDMSVVSTDGFAIDLEGKSNIRLVDVIADGTADGVFARDAVNLLIERSYVTATWDGLAAFNATGVIILDSVIESTSNSGLGIGSAAAINGPNMEGVIANSVIRKTVESAVGGDVAFGIKVTGMTGALSIVGSVIWCENPQVGDTEDAIAVSFSGDATKEGSLHLSGCHVYARCDGAGDPFTLTQATAGTLQVDDTLYDKTLTSGTITDIENDIVTDTGELQTDWTDSGRLDLILDATGKTGADSDTLETLSDQIDTLSALSGGGAFTGTLTVDDGATGLQGVVVNARLGGILQATGTTDVNGQITNWAFDANTFDLASQISGYQPSTDTLVVTADAWTKTVSLTLIAITAPPNASTITGVTTAVDEEGVAESGVSISVQILAGPGTAGLAYDSADWTETSDGSGIVQFAGLVKGALYKGWRGDSKPNAVEFTAPTTGDSFNLPEVIGRG